MTKRAFVPPRGRSKGSNGGASAGGNRPPPSSSDGGEQEPFEVPDLGLVALSEKRSAAPLVPEYVHLEQEVVSLRNQLESLKVALTRKTAELEGLKTPSTKPVTSPSSEVPPSSHRGAPPSVRRGDASLRSLQVSLSDTGRRETSRFPVRLEVEFMHEAEFYAGLTRDLSEGGLFVATYHVLPLQTELILHLELGSGERLEVRGRVRWIRAPHSGSVRPGMGIQFCDLSPAALSSIQRLCRDRAPLYVETD